MDELHRAADKLGREMDILEAMGIYTEGADAPEKLQLILAQAKRVRRAVNFLVKVAAQRRDSYQPSGGT